MAHRRKYRCNNYSPPCAGDEQLHYGNHGCDDAKVDNLQAHKTLSSPSSQSPDASM
jgi:hypothetical protein